MSNLITKNNPPPSPRGEWYNYYLNGGERKKIEEIYHQVIKPGEVNAEDDMSIHFAAQRLIQKMAETDEKYRVLTTEHKSQNFPKYKSIFILVEKNCKKRTMTRAQTMKSVADTDSEGSTDLKKRAPTPVFNVKH